MTDPFDVPAHEFGVTRVFAVEGAEAPTPDAAARRLGASHVDPAKIEVLPAGATQDMTLTAYLAEGYGIPEDSLAERRAELDALGGHVLLVPSSAFGGQAQRLSPDDTLRLVGAFRESPDPAHDVMQPQETAATPIEPPRTAPMTTAHERKRINWIVVAALVIAALLTMLVVF